MFPLIHQLPQTFSRHLNGEEGCNRERQQRCQINATNDYEALQCWLNEYQHKTTTHRTYQKEAERFLLWSLIQREKPLSSLDRDDLAAYIQFLDDPQPKEKWCGKPKGRASRRGQAAWRPFSGPLSRSSKMTALSVIDSLLSYLVDAHYLNFNPLSLIKKRHVRAHQQQEAYFRVQDRILALDEWHALLDTLDAMPETTPAERNEKARVVFLIHILYFLGLRVNELATHTWAAFRKVEDKWWFYVVGKGDKAARIPVSDELLKATIKYRTHFRLRPLPNQERLPIIQSFTTALAITPRQINKILKKLALTTAKKFKDNPEKVAKFKKFSAHWLRHLSASMQDNANISSKFIRENLRHNKIETTQIYIHAYEIDRHNEMQKLRMRSK